MKISCCPTAPLLTTRCSAIGRLGDSRSGGRASRARAASAGLEPSDRWQAHVSLLRLRCESEITVHLQWLGGELMNQQRIYPSSDEETRRRSDLLLRTIPLSLFPIVMS